MSETINTLFDNLGRITQSQQITDGQTYQSGYQYNLSGALVQETYPSGRTVNNEFEMDGDLSRIFGKANATASEKTFANAFTYTADGKIKSLHLGNNLWESAKFNERLQVTELNLGHSATDGSLWKLGYEYGELNTDGVTVNTAKNTGNIAKQTVSFNGLAQPFVQTYKYDSLYRLTEAKETNNNQQTWKQTFGYDRYGNRTTYQKYIGTTKLVLDNKTFPQIDATTNRILTTQSYTYDLNGNLVQDADGRQFTFNGENKQTLVKDINNNVIGQYYYDGEGKRVKKVTNTETTIFVYSSGKLIAEYSTATPPQNPTTSYTATDQLGSPRVITDAFGTVAARRDFQPFGEELYAGIGGRTGDTGQKYSSSKDKLRQKFTGYQRDDETNLDFAEARYYNNAHGRFTAVDPLLASGKSANPQTFNRYVYVSNNPLLKTDPTGMFEWVHDKNAPEGINRPVWVSHEEFTKGGYDEWQDTTFTTSSGDEVTLDRSGPFSIEGTGDSYLGWSKNGLTQGTGLYKNLSGYGSPQLQRISDNYYSEAVNSENTATKFGLYLTSFCVSICVHRPQTINDRIVMQGVVPLADVPEASSFNSLAIRQLGIAGEEAVGINTAVKVRIPSLTGTAKYRIPEELTETTLTEVKNVQRLGLTRQIRDFHLYAQQNDLRFTIFTRSTTKISRPLQMLFNEGQIFQKTIPSK